MTVEEHVQTRAALLIARLQAAESDRARRRAWQSLQEIAALASLKPVVAFRNASNTVDPQTVAQPVVARCGTSNGRCNRACR